MREPRLALCTLKVGKAIRLYWIYSQDERAEPGSVAVPLRIPFVLHLFGQTNFQVIEFS